MQNDPTIDLEEYRGLFLEECQRHLQTLNEGILRLEQDPHDRATLGNVFRAAHTLKGMAAAMGYDAIARLSHAMEDSLDHARVQPDDLAPLISPLLGSIDTIEMMVSDIAAGSTADLEVTAVIEALHAAEPGHRADMVGALGMSHVTLPSAYGDFEVEEAPRLPPSGDSPEDDAVGTEVAAERPELPVHPSVPSVAESLRVSRMVHLDVTHLDRLLSIVTEMVIHRGYGARLMEQGDLVSLKEALTAHNRMLDRLQDAVLKTRMVPVGQVFDRFSRMVRDLLKAQSKDAQLVIEGAQVELDRTILAAVGDTLVHLLRNAVDHGLELPEEREAAGKPHRGTIRLSAYHERDVVVIEVRDDGSGIDVRQVADVAVERSIVTRAALAEMNEAQILELICAPGFSSSTEVTAVSGRGVGMDAVKRQIELVRGTLGIESHLGRGSVFRLRLPVNLALLDALLVMVAGKCYAVPASHVERILEVDPETLTYVGEKVLMNLSEGVLPLRQASELLDGRVDSGITSHALIMQRHNRSFAIGVDSVIGYEQIVAKPLPPVLEAISCLSGVTILAEGTLAFIVDLVGV